MRLVAQLKLVHCFMCWTPICCTLPLGEIWYHCRIHGYLSVVITVLMQNLLHEVKFNLTLTLEACSICVKCGLRNMKVLDSITYYSTSLSNFSFTEGFLCANDIVNYKRVAQIMLFWRKVYSPTSHKVLELFGEVFLRQRWGRLKSTCVTIVM